MADQSSGDLPWRDDEVFWMLLSFLVLEPEQQLLYLSGPVPSRNDPRVHGLQANPLLQLRNVLLKYQGAWISAFDPATRSTEELIEELCEDLESRTDAESGAVMTRWKDWNIFCLEEFLHGDSWNKMRALARTALDESGLPPHPIPRPIPLDELLELNDC